MSISRTSFTFRLALEEIKQVGAQLTHLTDQAKTLHDSVDNAQCLVDKKRKELRNLTKRVDDRRKVLEKLQKKASGGSSRQGKLRATTRSEEEVNTTFATEDLSISMSISSPSQKKKKRFAGVWDDVDIARADKRARADGEESKENDVPAGRGTMIA